MLEFLFSIGLNFISAATLKWAIKATEDTELQEQRQSKGCFPHRFSAESHQEWFSNWGGYPRNAIQINCYLQRHLWNWWDRYHAQSQGGSRTVSQENLLRSPREDLLSFPLPSTWHHKFLKVYILMELSYSWKCLLWGSLALRRWEVSYKYCTNCVFKFWLMVSLSASSWTHWAKSFQLLCCDHYIMKAMELNLFLYHPKSG